MYASLSNETYTPRLAGLRNKTHPGFLRKNNYFWAQLLFLVVLNVFAGVVLFGGYLHTGSLFGDTLKGFSFFHDNLHSLNYFGQIAWWNPNIQHGFPLYYASILAFDCATPLFVLTAATVWMLGLFRIHLVAYFPLFILYVGFLIPLLFSFGLLILARQIFRDHKVILFVLLLSAFSPGVVVLLSSNLDIENTAYSLYFAAAFLNFLRKPDRQSFLWLGLTTLILAVTFTRGALLWNIFFVPLFVMAIYLFSDTSNAARIRNALRSVPRWNWFVFVLLTVFCLMPAVITSAQGSDIQKAGINSRIYSFRSFRPGNPLEVLTVGTPAIGFWRADPEGPDLREPLPLTHNAHTTKLYTYMGMLLLPLSFIGLAVGTAIWRRRLFFILAVTCTIIPLSGFSPFFASLLIWPSPVRVHVHYYDTFFRCGTFLVLILAAGLGLRVILRYPRKLRWIVILVFTLTSLGSILLFLVLYRGESCSQPMFGFALVMIVLYLITLVWLVRAKGNEKSTIFAFLLFLTFLDISTNAFWYVRDVILPQTTRVVEPPGEAIGLVDSPASIYANKMLTLRSIRELEEAGGNIAALPVLALFDAARIGNLTEMAKMQIAPGETTAILLSKESQRMEEFKDFFAGGRGMIENAQRNIKIQKQTYNTLRLEVTAPRKSILFWLDAYSPHWKAIVDGKAARIAPAFWGFKAIVVPEGTSQVEFRFVPAMVPYALVFSYSIVVVVAIICLISYGAVKCSQSHG